MKQAPDRKKLRREFVNRQADFARDLVFGNRVPNRKKLRREYLRWKGWAFVGAILSGTLLVLAVACTLLLGIIAAGALYGATRDTMSFGWQFDVLFGLICVIGLSIAGFISWRSWKALQSVRRHIRSIQYVPPVIPHTLPADEILVRSSEEPPMAQSEVLLRAAKEQETPKEELLRVSQE